jgi:hypothetical protein
MTQRGEHGSETFSTQNVLKQGDVLSPLLFIPALGYAIKTVKENHEGLKLNGTCQILVYADYVILLSENMNTIHTEGF